MAHPVNFEGSNRLFTAPEGRDDIGDLPTFCNGACIVSAWEPTDEELTEIVRTRRVFISSFSGNVLYPVVVGSESAVRSVVVDYGKVWPKAESHG